MTLTDYVERYECARLSRQDGILEVKLHTGGASLVWGALPHRELPQLFYDISQDLENRIVILSGTGQTFSGPRPAAAARQARPAGDWDRIMREGKALLTNLLNIEVPMIAAINGPAMRHSELPLLCDIVLCSETASFEDAGHFESGFAPGDGLNIVYTMLLGINRARYFLLTSEVLDARQALQLGLVNEILPPEELMSRAYHHARKLIQHPDMHLRHTRQILVEPIKRQMQTQLSQYLALEAIANMDRARQ
jgi:enoyl-CoA hydratase/carnithine racemase